MANDDPYPCTVVRDRYNGAWSGGAWVAWPLEPGAVPTEPDDGDNEAYAFWTTCERLHGTGPTPGRGGRGVEGEEGG